MTPEALAEALRLRLPNTEITLGDKPGRVVVKMAPNPQPLTIHIALSKSGLCAEVSAIDPAQRPRDARFQPPVMVDWIVRRIVEQVDAHTTPDPRKWHQDPAIEPRIRAWAHLPDVLPMIRPKVDALLAADRAAIAKLRKEVVLHEEDIAALERALGVAP